MDCSAWHFSVGDKVRLRSEGVAYVYRGMLATVASIEGDIGELDIEMTDGTIRRGVLMNKDTQHLLTMVEQDAITPIEESELDMVLCF